MKHYSPYQFAFFRMILGTYLIIHFAMLIPYADEIWSNKGVMADNSLNFTYGIFPSVFDLYDSPYFVKTVVSLLLFLSILFSLGFFRQTVSILLWYGWVCLFDRNNLISNPGIPFVGWILLCCAFVPSGEPLTVFPKKNEAWEFPKLLFWGAWIIMSLGYTMSGIDKLNSPSWLDGSAIIHLLNNPLARDIPTREFLLSLPATLLNTITWSILILEIIFAPLAILSITRKWIWTGVVLMHFGILLVVDFADLTFGMLMIHLFTFDSRWLQPRHNNTKVQILFFDGVCGLCNNTVDLLMKEDRNDTLRFAPLQGETAKKYLPEQKIKHLNSVVFFRDGKIFTHSNAIIETARSMGGFMKLLVILKIVPADIRDLFYNIIADKRYKWFGVKETCRMPSEKERGKLLY